MKEDDRKKVPLLKDLHIDIGVSGGDEARRLVRIGDVAVIAGEPVEFPGGRFVSRSMDNRIGCYVALEAARLVAEAGGAPGDVFALAVTQEEITFAGARTSAYSLRPDVAIAVDVTFATDQPGLDEKEVGRHRFGTGPVLTRGSTLDPRVFELLLRGRRGGGHPVHGHGLGAGHRHRRGRVPHLARRDPDRRRVRAAALHALAGGDGPARGRRERGAADRGVRAAVAGRHRLQALGAATALRHRRHAAPAGRRPSMRWRCARRRVRCTACRCSTCDAVEYAGRTDVAIARDLLAGGGRDRRRRALGGRAAAPLRRPTSGCARPTCRRGWRRGWSSC